MSGVLDTILGGVVVVILCIFFIVGYFIYDAVAATGLIGSAYSAQGYGFYSALNISGVLIVLMLPIGAILAAYMTPTNPIFAGVSIAILFVQALVTPALINMLNSFAQSTSMATAASVGMGGFLQMAQYLPPLTIICAIIALIIGVWRTG
jgi:hypothetical protein